MQAAAPPAAPRKAASLARTVDGMSHRSLGNDFREAAGWKRQRLTYATEEPIIVEEQPIIMG